jgi:hypothetical protein
MSRIRLVSFCYIVTEDLLKRKWQGNPNCYMCGDTGNIDHLFSFVVL